MSQPLRTYSPDLVSVIIGERPITGFADGESITAERNNDAFTRVIGMTGEGARVRSNDRSGKITLKLMQTSPDNEYLSTLFNEDEATAARVFNVMIRDQNGTSLHEAQTAWIVKPANASFGKELADREWMIECDNLKMFSGGSNTSLT